MNKKTIGFYIDYKKETKGTCVLKYERSYSPTDDEFYTTVKYKDPFDKRGYITYHFIFSGLDYWEWENKYYRNGKINKILKKIRK